MTPFAVGIAGFGVLLVLIALRAPIALAMALTGLGGVWLLRDTKTVLFMLGTVPVDVLSSYALSTLPLFILMGNVAARGGVSTLLFDAINSVCGRLKGGLAIATVITAGAFSAASGSSLATASAMARVAAPEMLRRGYHPRLVSGSIGAGGTLGIMIPPSAMLIIYGILTETSISSLFIAGILPGIILVIAFSIAVYVWARMAPHHAPAYPAAAAGGLRSLLLITPAVALFGVIMGGIYGGLFTPTEAAAVGSGTAIIICWISGRLDFKNLLGALRDTAESSIVIYLIIIGTGFFQFFMEASRVPVQLTDIIIGLKMSPIATMLLIMAFLALLGCVMEGLGIMFLTVPLLFPIVLALGYDPIWFGIIMVLVIELGLITPPVGLNIYVIASLVPDIELKDAFSGLLPFAIVIVLLALLLLFLPQVALFLPSQMKVS